MQIPRTTIDLSSIISIPSSRCLKQKKKKMKTNWYTLWLLIACNGRIDHRNKFAPSQIIVNSVLAKCPKRMHKKETGQNDNPKRKKRCKRQLTNWLKRGALKLTSHYELQNKQMNETHASTESVSSNSIFSMLIIFSNTSQIRSMSTTVCDLFTVVTVYCQI